MEFFKYNKEYDNADILVSAWEILKGLKYFAMSIYRGRWEEAIDATYSFVINHYDREKGNLETYITSTLAKIYLNEGKKEVRDDLTTQIASDEDSYRKYESKVKNEFIELEESLFLSKDVKDCEDYLVPMFIEDFSFFEKLNPMARKLSYFDVRGIYDDKTIAKAIMNLRNKHIEDMQYLIKISKKCSHRNFSGNRYASSFDEFIELDCIINDVIIYKRKKNFKVPRYVYEVDLKTSIASLMYRLRNILSRKIGEIDVWCTFSGQILYKEEDILVQFENEIVGELLSSTDMYVLGYEKGNKIYFTSKKEMPEAFYISVLNREVDIPLISKVTKDIGGK